ncbi:hypothetical protein H6G33_09875 [Calothrix sp. FACHB-1219]|uniref:hypothetical protein n=1 Tax=unclassified Calothrix TaxID=2619626 RepID=UPI001686600A|nr:MULTISPECIES: hypothetical protein [unclassified Calothrix]MBD2201654.1 hypothetical protein [Calothrix sp. FACHB-168]MBD2217340.1 hypothetical protein [Calothrix sp. FACHB-1219]
MQLANALRQLTVQQVGNKLEIYRRFYIFPLLWRIRSGNDIAAKESFQVILDESNIRDINYYDLIASSLEGKYTLPEFINDNIDEWMECIKFLAYGNSEIERTLPDWLYNNANKVALDAIREELLVYCM